MARNKGHSASYYLPGAKRPFAHSTVSTSQLLGAFAGHGLTIRQARELARFDTDAVVVLDGFIAAGYGDRMMTDLGFV